MLFLIVWHLQVRDPVPHLQFSLFLQYHSLWEELPRRQMLLGHSTLMPTSFSLGLEKQAEHPRPTELQEYPDPLSACPLKP
jgi:hypothetical protein